MKERVEINGASRDVLELTRDEVRKSGARVFWRLRDALAWLDRRGHTRTTLLGNDTTRLSNACPNGISNFAGRVRSWDPPGQLWHRSMEGPWTFDFCRSICAHLQGIVRMKTSHTSEGR